MQIFINAIVVVALVLNVLAPALQPFTRGSKREHVEPIAKIEAGNGIDDLLEQNPPADPFALLESIAQGEETPTGTPTNEQTEAFPPDETITVTPSPIVSEETPEPTVTASESPTPAATETPEPTVTVVEEPTVFPSETPTVTPEPISTIIASRTISPTPLLTETLLPDAEKDPAFLEDYKLSLFVIEDEFLSKNFVTIQWKIETIEPALINSEWQIVFDYPNGFVPDSRDAFIRLSDNIFAMPVTSLSGEFRLHVPGRFYDNEIFAKLQEGDTVLSEATLSLEEKRPVNVSKAGGEVIKHLSKMEIKVKFSKNVLPDDAEITIQHPQQHPGNLPKNGYKIIELLAKNSNTRSAIHKFQAPVEIEIAYDPEEVRIDASVLSVFYYDEEIGMWFPIPSNVDRDLNVVRAWTDHFSLFTLGANSFDSYVTPPLDAAQVANVTGSASYSFPIDVPQGPGGIKPSISLNYNSMSVEGFSYTKPTSGDYPGLTLGTQVSWAGAGWSLSSGGSIIRNMGKNEDDTIDDTFSLTVGGVALQLVPISQTNSAYIDYKPTVDNSWVIRRYLSPSTYTFTNQTPASVTYLSEEDTWVAWDKTGTRYLFDTKAYYVETDKDGTTKNCGENDGVHYYQCSRRPWGWYLREIRYPSGNTLTYNWDIRSDDKYPKYTGGGGDLWGDVVPISVAVYPKEIIYPGGKVKVEFIKEYRPDYIYAWGDSLSFYNRYEKLRLTKIIISVPSLVQAGQWQKIREYSLNYVPDSSVTVFPESRWTPCSPNPAESPCPLVDEGAPSHEIPAGVDATWRVKNGKHVSVLGSITQFGVGGKEGNQSLPPVSFTYGQITADLTADGVNQPVTYNQNDKMHLSRVYNGQGGSVYFLYEEMAIDPNAQAVDMPWTSNELLASQLVYLLNANRKMTVNTADDLFRIDPVSNPSTCDPNNPSSCNYQPNGLSLRPNSGYLFKCDASNFSGSEIRWSPS